MRLDLFVKLKYQSSTIVLFVSIRYSMHDLFSGVPRTTIVTYTLCLIHWQYATNTVKDVSALSGISSP